jgi:hypothetical protein
MSKTNTLETEWLDLYFTNVAMAGVGDASGLQPSAAAGSVHVSLHTAWPGETGNQSTSEATYTSYARVAVARSTAEWTVTGDTASNDNLIQFPQCTGLTDDEDIFFAGIGDDLSGAGKLRYIAHLGNAAPLCFTADDTADTLLVPGHSFVNDNRAVVFNPPGTTLPTGLTEGTVYWVVGVSGDTFQLSTTQGGGAVNITADGNGTVALISPLNVTVNVTPQFPATNLQFQEN